MTTRSLFYICNFFDDATRLDRGIATDSPAASKKVHSISQAVRSQGARAFIVSMGRGKPKFSGKFFNYKIKRIKRVPVIYLPFIDFPILSQITSLLAFFPLMFRFKRVKGDVAFLFYNRMLVYLVALFSAKIFGLRSFLDLEDGEPIFSRKFSLEKIKWKLSRFLFDSVCKNGALIACSPLSKMTDIRPVLNCYGVYQNEQQVIINEPIYPLTVLLAGTISEDTGADLLLNAIEKMRSSSNSFASKIRIEISGKGNYIDNFLDISKDKVCPEVIVHGRLSDSEYSELLKRTTIGLALKPNKGILADTTFPSKVIEFASHRVLVLTTDISDVKKVLGCGALYLTDNSVDQLIYHLKWVIENHTQANSVALLGLENVRKICSLQPVGSQLVALFFGKTYKI